MNSKLWTRVSLILVSGLLFSCSDDDVESVPADNSGEVGYSSYLTVSLSMPESSGTRAVADENSNVTSANEGTPSEEGTTAERTINTVYVYAFQAPSNTSDGVTNDDDWTFVERSAVSAFSDGEAVGTTAYRYGTAVFKSLHKSYDDEVNTYHLYAVVNAKAVSESGDGENWPVKGTTTVKDFLETARFDLTATGDEVTTYTKTVSTFEPTTDAPMPTSFASNNFVMASRQFDDMSSVGNYTTRYATLSIASDNSETNPARVTIAVERVMARMDLARSYDYSSDLKSPSDDKFATVTLDKYYPINLSKESFLFRHKKTGTSSALSGAYAFNNLADLVSTNWSSGWQSADYVVDPNTENKKEKVAEGEYTIMDTKDILHHPLHSWWGEKDATGVKAAPTAMKTFTQLASDGADVPTIGYCLENTTLADMQQEEFSTGVIIAGTLVPDERHLYVNYQAASDSEAKNYTFADYKTQVTDAKIAETLYYYNYNFYASEEALKAAGFQFPSNYETIENDKASNASWKSKKQLLSEYGVTTFEATSTDGNGNGVFTTYYIYILKHHTLSSSLNDAAVMSPMKFAVVRNNVYQMKVKGVSDLGSASPDPTDPDPTDGYEPGPNPDEEYAVYLQMELQVRNWVLRDQGGTITLK